MDREFIRKLLYVLGITDTFESTIEESSIMDIFTIPDPIHKVQRSLSHNICYGFKKDPLPVMEAWGNVLIRIECALLDNRKFRMSETDSHWVHVMDYECKSPGYAGALPIIGRKIDTEREFYGSSATHYLYMDNPILVFCESETITATHAIFYVLEYPKESSVLVSCVDFGGRQTSFDGRFSVDFSYQRGVATIYE